MFELNCANVKQPQAWFATPWVSTWLSRSRLTTIISLPISSVFTLYNWACPSSISLRANRIPHKFRLARSGQADLLAELANCRSKAKASTC